jgi:carboxylesterase
MSAAVADARWPILPGAEPFSHPGDPTFGVLLVHGFTGSPHDMRSVGAALAAEGIGSECVRLRGHGTHPDDMVGRAYTQWIEDVEAGLDGLLERYRRAAVVGLSMGGTLALNVAARRADDSRLLGLVTVSAPLYLSDWRLGLVEYLSRVIKWQAWGRPDILDERAWDGQVAYRRIRTRAIPQLLALIRETDGLLPRVRQPILIAQSREDHVVPPGNLEHIRNGVGSADRRALLLENCYHLSTVDFSAALLNTEIVRFIRDLTVRADTVAEQSGERSA